MGNNGGVYTWSQTAANNATADATVNWEAGMAPSAVSPSGRAMMASMAKYRDDISGSIVTTGTSTAYIVSSNQGFDTLADFNGKVIAFSPHATNGVGPVTMTVDGFANLPLRSAPNTELLEGVIIKGTPYAAIYNASDNALYLQGFFGNPYNIPLASGMDYWAATAPNSCFTIPTGQLISRTTYAPLFSLIGTTYGAGDGATTFALPDVRGFVRAAMDNLNGAPAGRLTNIASSLGANGGAQAQALAVANLPSATLETTISDPGHVHTEQLPNGGSGASFYAGTAGTANYQNGPLTTEPAETGITASTQLGGSNEAHNNIQPTIVCNYIMRII